MKLDDLLGVERAEADGADVGSLVLNLQLVQSQRGITLTHKLAGINARACSSFMYWRAETGIIEASSAFDRCYC